MDWRISDQRNANNVEPLLNNTYFNIDIASIELRAVECPDSFQCLPLISHMLHTNTSTQLSHYDNTSLRPFSMINQVSRYQNVSILDFIAAKDERGGGDNWSYKTCKAPVKTSPSTNQYPAFYRSDAISAAQPTVSKQWRENISHSMDLFTPSSIGSLPTLSLTTKGSLIPWQQGGQASRQPLMPVPDQLSCYLHNLTYKQT